MAKNNLNSEYENIFIEQFIVKERRERIRFELDGKKRRDALSKFCHDSEDLLMMNRVVYSGNDISQNALIKLAEENCKSKLCYIMAYNNDIDGIVCSFEEAVEKVVGNGMAAIIISDGFAIVETEQCFGSAQKYVLSLKR